MYITWRKVNLWMENPDIELTAPNFDVTGYAVLSIAITAIVQEFIDIVIYIVIECIIFMLRYEIPVNEIFRSGAYIKPPYKSVLFHLPKTSFQ